MPKVLISDSIDGIAEKILKSNHIDVDVITDLNSNQLNQASFFDFISGMTNTIHSENLQFFMMFVNNIEEEKKAYEKKIINGITFILIDIYKAYKAMTHELRLKKGLIYPSTKV